MVVWLRINQIVWADKLMREKLEESRFCGHDIEYVYELRARRKKKNCFSCQRMLSIVLYSIQNKFEKTVFWQRTNTICIISFGIIINIIFTFTYIIVVPHSSCFISIKFSSRAIPTFVCHFYEVLTSTNHYPRCNWSQKLWQRRKSCVFLMIWRLSSVNK